MKESKLVFFRNDDVRGEKDESLVKLTEVYNTLGFVLHHRYHTRQEHFDLVNDLIAWIKTLPDVSFVKQEDVYMKNARKSE